MFLIGNFKIKNNPIYLGTYNNPECKLKSLIDTYIKEYDVSNGLLIIITSICIKKGDNQIDENGK